MLWQTGKEIVQKATIIYWKRIVVESERLIFHHVYHIKINGFSTEQWIVLTYFTSRASKSLHFLLDFHHLSSQTGAHSPPALWCRAALNEQPAVGPAHLAFGQPSRIDTNAADHILRTVKFHLFQQLHIQNSLQKSVFLGFIVKSNKILKILKLKLLLFYFFTSNDYWVSINNLTKMFVYRMLTENRVSIGSKINFLVCQ